MPYVSPVDSVAWPAKPDPSPPRAAPACSKAHFAFGRLSLRGESLKHPRFICNGRTACIFPGPAQTLRGVRYWHEPSNQSWQSLLDWRGTLRARHALEPLEHPDHGGIGALLPIRPGHAVLEAPVAQQPTPPAFIGQTLFLAGARCRRPSIGRNPRQCFVSSDQFISPSSASTPSTTGIPSRRSANPSLARRPAQAGNAPPPDPASL